MTMARRRRRSHRSHPLGALAAVVAAVILGLCLVGVAAGHVPPGVIGGAAMLFVVGLLVRWAHH